MNRTTLRTWLPIVLVSIGVAAYFLIGHDPVKHDGKKLDSLQHNPSAPTWTTPAMDDVQVLSHSISHRKRIARLSVDDSIIAYTSQLDTSIHGKDTLEYYAINLRTGVITDSFEVVVATRFSEGDSVMAKVVFPSQISQWWWNTRSLSTSTLDGSASGELRGGLPDKAASGKAINALMNSHWLAYAGFGVGPLIELGGGGEVTFMDRLRIQGEAGFGIIPAFEVQARTRIYLLF